MSVFRGEGAGWNRKDRMIALALKLYEQSLFPDCKADRSRTHDDRMDGEYHVEVETCYRCAAVEEWQRDQREELPAGTKLYVAEDEDAPSAIRQQ
jgi:hypothetical protein